MIDRATLGCGYEHTALIDNSGNLWTCGNNLYGQLGQDHSAEQSTLQKIWEQGDAIQPNTRPNKIQSSIFTRVEGLKDIIVVSCGSYETLCVDTEGCVWGFGRNSTSQLGLGTSSMEKYPKKIPNLRNIISVHCGKYHTLALDSSGEVWGFGSNMEGQLGLGPNNTDVCVPTKIDGLSDIRSISCGATISFCMSFSRGIYCFGMFQTMQYGLGVLEGKYPVVVPDSEKYVQVECAETSTLLLDNNGDVYTTHSNGRDPNSLLRIKLPEIKSMVCGASHSLFVDVQGDLWGYGWNAFSQAGFALGQGPSTFPQPKRIPDITEVCALSAGGHHSVVKEAGGNVWVFGLNSFGQLGLGHSNSPIVPTRLPNDLAENFAYHGTRSKSARK